MGGSNGKEHLTELIQYFQEIWAEAPLKPQNEFLEDGIYDEFRDARSPSRSSNAPGKLDRQATNKSNMALNNNFMTPSEGQYPKNNFVPQPQSNFVPQQMNLMPQPSNNFVPQLTNDFVPQQMNNLMLQPSNNPRKPKSEKKKKAFGGEYFFGNITVSEGSLSDAMAMSSQALKGDDKLFTADPMHIRPLPIGKPNMQIASRSESFAKLNVKERRSTLNSDSVNHTPLPGSVIDSERSIISDSDQLITHSKAMMAYYMLIPNVRNNEQEHEGLKHPETGLTKSAQIPFLNAIAQCMFASQPLAEYFLYNVYTIEQSKFKHLTMDQRLITDLFAQATKAFWTNDYESLELGGMVDPILTLVPDIEDQGQDGVLDLLDAFFEELHNALNRQFKGNWNPDKDPNRSTTNSFFNSRLHSRRGSIINSHLGIRPSFRLNHISLGNRFQNRALDSKLQSPTSMFQGGKNLLADANANDPRYKLKASQVNPLISVVMAGKHNPDYTLEDKINPLEIVGNPESSRKQPQLLSQNSKTSPANQAKILSNNADNRSVVSQSSHLNLVTYNSLKPKSATSMPQSRNNTSEYESDGASNYGSTEQAESIISQKVSPVPSQTSPQSVFSRRPQGAPTNPIRNYSHMQPPPQGNVYEPQPSQSLMDQVRQRPRMSTESYLSRDNLIYNKANQNFTNSQVLSGRPNNPLSKSETKVPQSNEKPKKAARDNFFVNDIASEAMSYAYSYQANSLSGSVIANSNPQTKPRRPAGSGRPNTYNSKTKKRASMRNTQDDFFGDNEMYDEDAEPTSRSPTPQVQPQHRSQMQMNAYQPQDTYGTFGSEVTTRGLQPGPEPLLIGDNGPYQSPARFARAGQGSAQSGTGSLQPSESQLPRNLKFRIAMDLNIEDHWSRRLLKQTMIDSKQAWKSYLEENSSIVIDTFMGQMMSTIICITCGRVSNKFEPYLYVSLPIPEKGDPTTLDIYDCFDEFTQEYYTTIDENWFCSDCRAVRLVTLQATLWIMSNILILNLTRTDMDDPSFWYDTKVDAPLDRLDLRKYWNTQERDEPIYKLFGVVDCIVGEEGLKYIAKTRDGNSDTWNCFEDDTTTRIEDPEKEVITGNSYLLFYQKSSPQFFARQEASHPELWPYLDKTFNIANFRQKSYQSSLNPVFVNYFEEQNKRAFDLDSSVEIQETIPETDDEDDSDEVDNDDDDDDSNSDDDDILKDPYDLMAKEYRPKKNTNRKFKTPKKAKRLNNPDLHNWAVDHEPEAAFHEPTYQKIIPDDKHTRVKPDGQLKSVILEGKPGDHVKLNLNNEEVKALEELRLGVRRPEEPISRSPSRPRSQSRTNNNSRVTTPQSGTLEPNCASRAQSVNDINIGQNLTRKYKTEPLNITSLPSSNGIEELIKVGVFVNKYHQKGGPIPIVGAEYNPIGINTKKVRNDVNYRQINENNFAHKEAVILTRAQARALKEEQSPTIQPQGRLKGLH